MKRKISILFFLFFVVVAYAREYAVNDVPNVYLQDSTQLLSNPDGIVPDSVAAEINRLLLNIRRRATAEVVAVVVSDFEGDDIDEFATALFKSWGLGKKGNDNGILLIVAKDRHKLTIRTGYGAEGVLPDIICGRIIRHDIVPLFKKDRYGEGVLAGVREIHRLVTNPAAVEELKAQIQKEDGDGWLYFLGFFGIFGLIVALLMKFGKKGGTKGDGNNQSDNQSGCNNQKSGAKSAAAGAAIGAAGATRKPQTGGHSSSGSRGGHFGGGSTGGGGATGSW